MSATVTRRPRSKTLDQPMSKLPLYPALYQINTRVWLTELSRQLGHRATLGADGEPLVDGRPWTDSTVLADVRRIVGPDARLVRDADLDVRFDVLPLLVATDGAIAAFGRDGRRLRPNLIIGGVSGLDERRWPGCRLHIGDAVVEVDSLRGRCVMTTVDPDSLEQDPRVLRDIVNRFGGRLALNCAVVRGGPIHVGQPVELVEMRASEPLSTGSR